MSRATISTAKTGIGIPTNNPPSFAVKNLRRLPYSSRGGDNVLGLFGSSGSTLIAAKQTGRKAFLTEIVNRDAAKATRGDKTAIELFLAGIRGWEAGLWQHFPGIPD
jgi:hypothetical protein